MNTADLEDALPAFTLDLFSDDLEQADVLVLDQDETVPPRPRPHVVWRFVQEAPVPEAGGLGRHVHALRYTLEIHSPSATQEDRRRWPQEVRATLHQRRKPFGVEGLDHAEVLESRVVDELGAGNPGLTGPARAEFDVAFVGDVLVSDPAPVVSPADLGALIWLDAQDETTLTLALDKVVTWADKSPNGNDFTQGTAGQRPTFGAEEWNGFRPGVTFDRTASQHLYKAAFSAAGEAGEVYLVVDLPGTLTGDQSLLAFDGTVLQELQAYLVEDGGQHYAGIDCDTGLVRGVTPLSPGPQVLCFRSDGLVWSIALDGEDETITVLSGANSGDWLSDVGGLTQAVLGADSEALTDFLDATIGEAVVVPALTDPQRAGLLAYFLERWGVP